MSPLLSVAILAENASAIDAVMMLLVMIVSVPATDMDVFVLGLATTAVPAHWDLEANLAYMVAQKAHLVLEFVHHEVAPVPDSDSGSRV